jgi:serine/threonine protein kinase
MERVTARSLHEILGDSGSLPPAAVARIGLDVLAGLEAAHAAGIVHRDVKPANVLVDSTGHARLTDFGIATTAGDPALTGGALIGSPPYMAPERATGDDSGPAADLWSLGATLYCAVEGEKDEPMATLMAVVTEDPPPPACAGPLGPALLGLLAKDPAQRSTPARARAQLEAALASGPAQPAAAPTPPAAPPKPARSSRGSVAVLTSDDLRALATASKAVLSAMVGTSGIDARIAARESTRGRRQEAAGQRKGFRRRVKRRMLKLALTVVGVVVLAVVAVVLFVLHLAGVF